MIFGTTPAGGSISPLSFFDTCQKEKKKNRDVFVSAGCSGCLQPGNLSVCEPGLREPAAVNMAAVDVEDESILASIFKDSFPDSWRDNPDFAAYLSELSSFGVEKLGREPERLAEERAQILQQTRELAFSNYQTFIRTADCTEHIYRDFGRVESSVSRLLDKLPRFGENCRSVAPCGGDVSRRKLGSIKHLKCHHLLLG